MTSIPYDATRASLFHPGNADNFFQLGATPNDAALCAEMARLAYVKEEARLAPYLARAQFDKVLALGYHNLGTQAFVAVRPRDALTVVAFRGSEPEDPSDIFADAEFGQTAWHDAAGHIVGKVHEGFARFAHDDDIFRRIKGHLDTLPATQRVLITGHSLGAALATLLANWLPTGHVYTFGCPRVGNADFARSIKNPVAVRYVNCRDIVTRVPPDNLPLNEYRHAGTLNYINRSGKPLGVVESEAIQKDRTRATIEYLPRALLPGTVFSRDLADHAPINYVSAVMELRA